VIVQSLRVSRADGPLSEQLGRLIWVPLDRLCSPEGEAIRAWLSFVDTHLSTSDSIAWPTLPPAGLREADDASRDFKRLDQLRRTASEDVPSILAHYDANGERRRGAWTDLPWHPWLLMARPEVWEHDMIASPEMRSAIRGVLEDPRRARGWWNAVPELTSDRRDLLDRMKATLAERIAGLVEQGTTLERRSWRRVLRHASLITRPTR
jgi:hypothetical protein